MPMRESFFKYVSVSFELLFVKKQKLRPLSSTAARKSLVNGKSRSPR